MRSQDIINVASVPHRSPFRFPGGKTWLIPRIRNWLQCYSDRKIHFIEPFAGGAISSLTVAAEKLAEKITMVELDKNIAAVWQVIINEDSSQLIDRIRDFNLTIENALEVLSSKPSNINELAFRTILHNRISHGGIMANGSGIMKNGENGRGIKSRWYANTIIKRIEKIQQFRNRVEFIHDDGFNIIGDLLDDENAIFFIDPPYTASGKAAGRRLYDCNQINHDLLFKLTSEIKGGVLVTYDNAPEVKKFARKNGLDYLLVSMKSTHHSKQTELLISNNLDWERKRPIQLKLTL